MGTFTYGQPQLSVEFDDRLLSHLRAVIVDKLRRNECFLFSWTEKDGPAPVQQSLWMHPGIGMRFTITVADVAPLNRAWIAILAAAANSNRGLAVIPEPGNTPADPVHAP